MLGLALATPAQTDTGTVHSLDLDGAYTDATGLEIAFRQDAGRIVSLAPNVTEMVCYLGLGDRLVGRSDYCDYPPEVHELPSVGGFVDTSLEAIVALDPDLVIAYQGNSRELVDQLRELGITVLALEEARALNQIAQQMLAMAIICGSQDQNPEEQAALFMKGLTRFTISSPEPYTVFYGYPGELMYTCAPGTHIDDLITWAGGSNIVTDNSIRWPQVSAEFVVAANPDYILTGTSCTEDQDPDEVRARLIDELRADTFWTQLDAVSAGRVIVIDSDILNRPGPRILDALEQFSAQLRPEHRPPTQEVDK
jgi:iron complex transport system substrate-binding protein